MSPALALAILAGLLTVLNLALTVGVIRRLREHTELFEARGNVKPPVVPVMALAGERSKPFTSVTTDGVQVTEADLTGGLTLVAAMAYGCSSCEERRPDFVAMARRFPGGRDRVLAVFVGGEDDLSAERAMLEPVSRLVFQENTHEGITEALNVSGYPAFAILDADGTVLTSGTKVQDLDLDLAPSVAGV
ncbi:hypothetical protein OG394_22785 [Kribbella sp. NBC_01245]|uniref:TlpA family protein disulfide reductase n=1 Tax=Kribbella sp. NBC_01245 TaxID=2903578 RepID=UPI002E2AF82F|nr:hypothetical protein [Kribbella sp. NBC_01245]